jgi:uncharacterized membrane-anchored protein
LTPTETGLPSNHPEFEPPPDPKPDGPVGRFFAWLSGQERTVIIAAVLFQLFILAAMVLTCALPTHGAPTVLLRVVPVDPRDLMRGDYVTLGYEISRLPSAPQPGLRGSTVYVTLLPEPDGRHFRGGGVSAERPASGRFIRGTVNDWNGITFGIESYFVQEGKGHDYEQAIRSRKLSAKVALASDGQAALRGLVFD